MKDEIKNFVQFIKEQGLYPDTPIIEGPSTDPEILINGKKFLIFCSNNYLGLANKDFLKDAAIECIKKYGVGPAGARLMAGNLDIYNELEKTIADFLNKEDAMIFSTGYAANLGAIKALVDPLMGDQPFKKGDSVIFSDELNHTSIIQGCKLSSAERVIYKHNDPTDLENKIKDSSKARKLIITDGVFSMDGDIVPLPEIISLAKKYNAIVMVDDAHGIGVLGKTGKGTDEFFNIDNGVDITMGTLVKAFGTMGGFIAGKKDVIDYLKISAKTYIFSVPMSPVMAGASIEAIKYVKQHPEVIQNLTSNADHLRGELNKIGYNTLTSQSPIIPVLLGPEKTAINFAKDLMENGIYIPAIRWPAVDKNKSRIRISVMAHHTKEHLDRLLKVMKDLKKKYFEQPKC
ncbi:aminotransferase class I/II-fold pyridoxal phosphate-dependent enzyme [Patescibacteria group bacterium]|nr:MAG: aminotransferase class I/II-fold pyridoxal phosphate-dependent enzyme [Patescibacteria group bacterium]